MEWKVRSGGREGCNVGHKTNREASPRRPLPAVATTERAFASPGEALLWLGLKPSSDEMEEVWDGLLFYSFFCRDLSIIMKKVGALDLEPLLLVSPQP